MKKITNNIYVETGFRGCNPGFVVTKEGVVMIDAPQIPTDALKWRDEIAKEIYSYCQCNHCHELTLLVRRENRGNK